MVSCMPATSPGCLAPRTRLTMTRAAQSVLAMLVALVALVTAPSAQAHDTLIDASPGQGAAVEDVPTEVVLTFSAEILDLPTTIVVTASDGTTVAQGSPTVDGQAVRLALPPDLPNDDYEVTWSVVSSDGHRTENSYTFTLAAAANDTTTAPQDAAAPGTRESAQTPETNPAPEVDTSAQEDGSGWKPSVSTILLVQAGILVFAVAAALAYKRWWAGR